jgi:hypothetical protein
MLCKNAQRMSPTPHQGTSDRKASLVPNLYASVTIFRSPFGRSFRPPPARPDSVWRDEKMSEASFGVKSPWDTRCRIYDLILDSRTADSCASPIVPPKFRNFFCNRAVSSHEYELNKVKYNLTKRLSVTSTAAKRAGCEY